MPNYKECIFVSDAGSFYLTTFPGINIFQYAEFLEMRRLHAGGSRLRLLVRVLLVRKCVGILCPRMPPRGEDGACAGACTSCI